MFDENTKKFLIKIFEEKLKDNITLLLYKGRETNKFVNIVEDMLKELSNLSPKISYKEIDNRMANLLKLRLSPSVLFEKKKNIIYYGIPSGYEFRVFVDTLIDVSMNATELPLNIAKEVAKIKENINILTFVTPNCPYCPIASRSSFKFAIINDKIRSEVVEASEFQEFSMNFNVFAVPKTVVFINGEKVKEHNGMVNEFMLMKIIKDALEVYNGNL